MGAGIGKPASAGPSVEGEYKYRFKTGYQFVTPNITSGPNVIKKDGIAGSQIWGPYKKKYVKSMFGQDLFTPPANVDGVPILCQCRFIYEYMRATTQEGAPIMISAAAAFISSDRPACWEDEETIWNSQGGDTFTVTVGHPGFYGTALNEGGIIGALTGFRGFKLGGTRMRRQKKAKQRKMAQRKRSTTRRFSR
jgi:hypothetical protein